MRFPFSVEFRSLSRPFFWLLGSPRRYFCSCCLVFLPPVSPYVNSNRISFSPFCKLFFRATRLQALLPTSIPRLPQRFSPSSAPPVWTCSAPFSFPGMYIDESRGYSLYQGFWKVFLFSRPIAPVIPPIKIVVLSTLLHDLPRFW